MTTEAFWDNADAAPEYLKGGFLGFPKSGKTFTSFLLACAVREVCGIAGPLAMYDTENGSGYLKADCLTLTGKALLVKRSRSFADLLAWGQRCADAGVAVGIADSVTHPWRELCDSYLKEKNEAAARMKKPQRSKLGFEDWQAIKPKWNEWTTFYMNAPQHFIVNGRAGWEYEMSKDEETGQKELNKTGVKMKTEGEFGFEPSLLVYMEAEQELIDGRPKLVRRATVLGDRFRLLDATTTTFPSERDLFKAYETVRDFFAPHISRLTAGTHQSVDTSARTSFGVDDSGDSDYYREKRSREILAEEIQADLVLAYPGQSAVEKKAKVEALRSAFGTGSWERVTSMSSRELREGREKLLVMLKPVKGGEAA